MRKLNLMFIILTRQLMQRKGNQTKLQSFSVTQYQQSRKIGEDIRLANRILYAIVTERGKMSGRHFTRVRVSGEAFKMVGVT